MAPTHTQLPLLAGFEEIHPHSAPGILSLRPQLSRTVADLLATANLVEIIRPYHGVTVHGDMSGDLGAAYPADCPRPDLTMVMTAAVLSTSGKLVRIQDENAQGVPFPGGQPEPDLRLVKLQLATWEADLARMADLSGRSPEVPVIAFGAVASHIPSLSEDSVILGDAPSALADLLEVPEIGIGRAYSCFPIDRYRSPNGGMRAHLQASRGCNRTCLYCPYIRTLGRWSARPIVSLADDVRALLGLGIEYIQFRDQDFASDIAHAEAVADVMRNVGQNRIAWSVEGNLDRFTPEVLANMRKGGATEVIVGIESVDPAVLRTARRKVVKNTRELLEQITATGLRARGLFITGLPEDNWGRAYATLRASLSLPLHAAQYNIYSPLPGEHFGIGKIASVHDFAPLSNDFKHSVCAAMSPRELQLATGWASRAFAADRAGQNQTRDRYLARFAGRVAKAEQAAGNSAAAGRVGARGDEA